MGETTIDYVLPCQTHCLDVVGYPFRMMIRLMGTGWGSSLSFTMFLRFWFTLRSAMFFVFSLLISRTMIRWSRFSFHFGNLKAECQASAGDVADSVLQLFVFLPASLILKMAESTSNKRQHEEKESESDDDEFVGPMPSDASQNAKKKKGKSYSLRRVIGFKLNCYFVCSPRVWRVVLGKSPMCGNVWTQFYASRYRNSCRCNEVLPVFFSIPSITWRG